MSVLDRHVVDVYLQSRDSLGMIRWPDGGAFLDQPVKLTQAFSLIEREMKRYGKI